MTEGNDAKPTFVITSQEQADECAAALKAWKASRARDHRKAYLREYQRSRRASDPEYRAKHNARMKASYARVRALAKAAKAAGLEPME